MIRELSELGKKLRIQNSGQKLIHDALKEDPISIDLVIKEDGSFHSFLLFEKKMTTAEAITAKKGKARLLLDKAEEVLGYGGESSIKKHWLFMGKLEQYKNLKELTPVLVFYGQNKINGLDKALIEFEKAIPNEKERRGNIAFRILNKDKRVHEESAVYQSLIEHYENEQKSFLATSNIKCSICGKTNYPVCDTPHGMIKRVPDGQSSGSALVSYNEDAFESYNLEGNNNSAICTNCAKTYVEGLNWLLSTGSRVKNKKGKEYTNYTNRKNFGSDTAMVFWTRENEKIKEIDLLDAPDPQEVASLIDSITAGETKNMQYLETDRFYSCTLSGAAARIVVRDWIETSLADFRKSIGCWFKDIAIDYYDFDLKRSQTYYSRLYELARCCQKEKENKDTILSRTAVYLWDAALKNTTLPLWILSAVLKRAQLDQNGVTRERASLIKLILNRNNRGGDFMAQEKLTGTNKPTAYTCGRIFAVLESIQRAAQGKTNAGIRERYFTFALTTPSPAFGRLFNLSSKHFTKLKGEKPGLAVVLDKELQSLCKEIKIENFPSVFTLEEQGQFAIGYYHQKQAQFNRAELKETIEEE
ncbi:MAG: type I-C CRISPR-associated protein Cas8c/Csd1 [Candidatus Omnitrophota bacterium]